MEMRAAFPGWGEDQLRQHLGKLRTCKAAVTRGMVVLERGKAGALHLHTP